MHGPAPFAGELRRLDGLAIEPISNFLASILVAIKRSLNAFLCDLAECLAVTELLVLQGDQKRITPGLFLLGAR